MSPDPSLNSRAVLLHRHGRAEDAEPLFAELIRLRGEVLGERHPHTLRSRHGYAHVLEDLDRAAEAGPLFAQEIQIFTELYGDGHPNTLKSIRDYGAWSLRYGEAQTALEMARKLSKAASLRAVSLLTDGLRELEQSVREMPERQNDERFLLDALWANLSSPQDDRALLAREAFTAMQLASAGSTNRAVAEAAAARFASGQGLSDVVRERQNLAREWPAIEVALVEAQVGDGVSATVRASLDARLAEIEARIAEIDAQLAAQAPEYFSILNLQAVDLEELQSLLGAEEAVLFLVPTEFGTHSMVVSGDEIVWQRSDADLASILGTASRFREGLEVQPGAPFLPQFDFDLAYQLYQDLVAPVASALEGSSRVYVVADGPLSRIPLTTLITEPLAEGIDAESPEASRSARWLADSHALVQLPSLQSLIYIRRYGNDAVSEVAGTFNGFGAPVLDGEAATRGARSATIAPVDASTLVSEVRAGNVALMDPEALRGLSALPGTRTELEQVRQALGAGEGSLFLATDMTEAAIRSADLSSTSILHLATHAFTSEEAGSLAEPGLVFTPPTEARPEDDGYLAASEVVGIDLTSAQWVILSACNTASPSGNPGETGLSGLAQSFFYAGAESLLVSHWPVFDDIAPVLTVKALTYSNGGMSRAEALQRAMREVRMDPELDASHPAVWAPFSLVGEGR